MRTCPHCALINTDEAVRCDCGLDLARSLDPTRGGFDAVRPRSPFSLLGRCYGWEGRLTRGEFAVAYFGSVLLAWVAALVLIAIGTASNSHDAMAVLLGLELLLGFAVSLGSCARRFNDLGTPTLHQNGFFFLMSLSLLAIPYLFFAASSRDAVRLEDPTSCFWYRTARKHVAWIGAGVWIMVVLIGLAFPIVATPEHAAHRSPPTSPERSMLNGAPSAFSKQSVAGQAVRSGREGSGG